MQKAIAGYHGDVAENGGETRHGARMKHQGDGRDVAWAAVYGPDQAKFITGSAFRSMAAPKR